MRKRNRVVPLVLVLVVALAGAGCGGGDSKPKEGSAAATGVAPDCSVVPLELASKSLKLELTGPTQGSRPDGTSCVFQRPGGGASAVETVLLDGNQTKESFDIIRDGYERSNIKVSNIDGWGDEAYAVRIPLFVQMNTFAVRKGKLSITITSIADFPEIRALMKELLKRLS